MTETLTQLKKRPAKIAIPRSKEVGVTRELGDKIKLFKTIDNATFGASRRSCTGCISDYTINSDICFKFNSTQLLGISDAQVAIIDQLSPGGLQCLRQSVIAQHQSNLKLTIDPKLEQVNSFILNNKQFDEGHRVSLEFIRPYLNILLKFRIEQSFRSYNPSLLDLQNKLLTKIFSDKGMEYIPILASDLTETVSTITQLVASDKLFYKDGTRCNLWRDFLELDELLRIFGIKGGVSSKLFAPEVMLPTFNRADLSEYVNHFQSQDPLFVSLKENVALFEAINDNDFFDRFQIVLESLPSSEKLQLIIALPPITPKTRQF